MYVEFLTFYNIFVIIYQIHKNKIQLKNKKIYYFDKTFFSSFLIILVRYFYKVEFIYLDFNLIDVKDHNDELVRLRIFRKDLIELQKQIVDNNQIFQDILKDKKLINFYHYLYKSLADGHIVMNPESLVRAVFIIQVCLWHSKKNNLLDSYFFISHRFWFKDLSIYAKKFRITLFEIPYIKKFHRKKNFFFIDITGNKYPFIFYLYKIVKNLFALKSFSSSENIKKSKIYSLSRSHFNLDNNGLHSDFFYFLNSDIKSKNIISSCINLKQKIILNNKNFSILYNNLNISQNLFFYNKNIILNKKIFKNSSTLEKKYFKKESDDFNIFKKNFYFFSKSNNIKIFLSWAKYSKSHISEFEAMNQLDGIYALWQFAFEGALNCNTQIKSDIYFSNFSKDYFFNNNSKINFFVNTGFVMDYRFELLKNKALKLRQLLIKNGAKNIIAVFDENSNHYNRWHTGHKLQAENYEHILIELLNNKNIGVIFKPKNSKTLRERIGSVNKLLIEAEKTGRCFVYEDYTENLTSAPPILAGLSADICVHTHLCAGTSAVECALANLPTLLLDREGSPTNLLYQMNDNNLIYKNWNDLINSLNDHFNSSNVNKNFGKWPNSFLNSLDSYRDGKAAYRMGEFLNIMLSQIHLNKSKNQVMSVAAEIYAKKYGQDKIQTFI